MLDMVAMIQYRVGFDKIELGSACPHQFAAYYSFQGIFQVGTTAISCRFIYSWKTEGFSIIQFCDCRRSYTGRNTDTVNSSIWKPEKVRNSVFINNSSDQVSIENCRRFLTAGTHKIHRVSNKTDGSVRSFFSGSVIRMIAFSLFMSSIACRCVDKYSFGLEKNNFIVYIGVHEQLPVIFVGNHIKDDCVPVGRYGRYARYRFRCATPRFGLSTHGRGIWRLIDSESQAQEKESS